MRFFALVVLAIAAIAAAVPAPQAISSSPDVVNPEPIIVLDIETPMSEGPMIAGVPFTPYSMFRIQIKEKCKNGVTAAHALWIHKDFQKQFDMDGVHPVTIKLNGKTLSINYKYQTNTTEFEFGRCRWTTNKDSKDYCGMSRLAGAWSRPVSSCTAPQWSRLAIWDIMFKGGYPDIEIDPRGESKGMTARKHVDLNTVHLEPTVDAKAPAMHLRTPVVASESFLERSEECPPYKACHPSCETQRRNLAECVCMRMTCGQGGHDYIRIKGKYDACCAANTAQPKKCDKYPENSSLFDIHIDPDEFKDEGFPRETYPGFWEYNLNMTEVYKSGVLTDVRAIFETRAGKHSISFDLECRNTIWATVNDKKLNMQYDVTHRWNNFEYNGCHWGQDMFSGHRCGGWCNNGGWYNKGDEKHIDLTCWIYLPKADGKAAPGSIPTIGARQSAPESLPADVMVTHPSWSLNPAVALVQDGKIGYFPFTLSVTEYCEATEGTPLKARGYFAPEGENGLNLSFDDGQTVYSIPIGWGNILVGGYDYWKHQLHFHYNGCHWDQDTNGWQDCGYCTSRPWSSEQLNCAVNAAAGRTHGIDCMVAVAYD